MTMDEPTSTLQSLLHAFLILSLLTTLTLLTLILTTLPTPYSHFRLRYLTKDAFTTPSGVPHPDKTTSTRFQQFRDAQGRLKFPTTIQILVLGDIGRSPRMQYHALSLASAGALVDMIGYTTSELHPEILNSAAINVVPLSPWPAYLQPSNRVLFLLLAPVKVVYQIAALHLAMNHRAEASKWILLQNPPSIPTLGVALLSSWLRNSRVVVDWHNFGYTILALRLGEGHPLVRVSEWYEGFFGRRAEAHLCVTEAMGRVLRRKWGVKAETLHDRPAGIFRPLSIGEREEWLRGNSTTRDFAEELLGGRRRLVVSSTSWTADEDFSVLLEALVEYSARVERSGKLPEILAVITGKGPQKDYYLGRVAEMDAGGKLKRVKVTTAWLSPEDYASLLGAADLGVSLHTSSSGVDLPMKVVDMFGTGLPVVGWHAFEAWGELVKEGINGMGFETAGRLAEILEELFGGDATKLTTLRDGAMKECERRWNDEWMPVAGKLFELDNAT